MNSVETKRKKNNTKKNLNDIQNSISSKSFFVCKSNFHCKDLKLKLFIPITFKLHNGFIEEI